MNKHLLITLAALPLFLVGCTQGQESFSTEPGKGFGWKHMSDTHEAIHRDMATRPSSIGTVRPVAVNPNLQGSVARIPEQYMKVWFAPYQDQAGNLHEESIVHTVMQTGQWMVPTIKTDGPI